MHLFSHEINDSEIKCFPIEIYIVKLFTHNRSDYAKLRCKIADPKIFKTFTEKHLRHIATSINLEAYQKPMVDCFSLDLNGNLLTQSAFTCSKSTNRNTVTLHEISSKVKVTTPERCQRRHSYVFIVNFEQISLIFLVFSSLTLDS